MSLKSTLLAASAALSLAMPAFADVQIMVKDAYARSSGATAVSGAAFMEIMNMGDENDQLVDVRSDIAKRVELHTHIETDQGVMQMRRVEGGFAIPAQGSHRLQRGGDHVMFMGLTRPMEDGTSFDLTLIFEKAGEVTIEVPVDLQRKPGEGAMQMDMPMDGS
ncbi:MAG TPA: copper chaperone PCu(A)C [Aliiroseovarius sp.]|nr:copper chaperone PCu(A)C [Aliiroseovarius sp.]